MQRRSATRECSSSTMSAASWTSSSWACSTRDSKCRRRPMARWRYGWSVRRRRNPTPGPQLQVQDVVMDEGTREVRREGRAIELSAREFDLLRLLMMHPNQVLPRDRILDQVWGYNFFGDANNVEVYIRYLRQKLGDEQHQLIQTVRGVGYRIKT